MSLINRWLGQLSQPSPAYGYHVSAFWSYCDRCERYAPWVLKNGADSCSHCGRDPVRREPQESVR